MTLTGLNRQLLDLPELVVTALGPVPEGSDLKWYSVNS